MNFHNMTQKNLFESYIAPTPVISRCYSSKVNTFSNFPGNSLYLGNMRHFNKKPSPFGRGHLKMPPLDHRTEFCDPLVKIVGGFVGSKSQAGTTNHRGRELCLWDVIVDKIIETMEDPEPRPQARKSVDTKKNGEIRSFTMIEMGRFGPECTTGPSFDCLSTKWYPPSTTDFVGSVLGQDGSPEMSNLSPTESEIGPLTKNSESTTKDSTWKTDTAAFCKDMNVPDEIFKGSLACRDVTPIAAETTSIDRSPIDQIVENGSKVDLKRNSPSSYERLSKSPDEIGGPPRAGCSTESPVLKCPVAARKHLLRPEAAEFTPGIPCRTRPSVESESEDDGSSLDVLSSSCESQTPSDTFLRPEIRRTLSECSVDSDDSFIVFESAEDDPVILSEDSDDEDSCSDEDLDEIDNLVLIPHNLAFSHPPQVLSRLEEANKKWEENYSDVNPNSATSTSKKVKFAEGNNLVKVKHLITWDFAHRAARIGPWEMYHRDSERFKSRIAALSAILSPVLAKQHREKIYSERFQS